MADIVEINCETGEVTERDFTPAELKEREKQIAEFEAKKAEEEAAAQAKAATKAAVLERLGLSEEEVAALLN